MWKACVCQLILGFTHIKRHESRLLAVTATDNPWKRSCLRHIDVLEVPRRCAVEIHFYLLNTYSFHSSASISTCILSELYFSSVLIYSLLTSSWWTSYPDILSFTFCLIDIYGITSLSSSTFMRIPVSTNWIFCRLMGGLFTVLKTRVTWRYDPNYSVMSVGGKWQLVALCHEPMIRAPAAGWSKK